MGLLDGGGASLLHNIFAPLYLDGTLYSFADVDDGAGSITRAETPIPAKVQIDQTTEAMRREPGYSGTDARVLILAKGLPTVTTDMDVSARGERYKIGSVSLDPVGAVWECRGVRA